LTKRKILSNDKKSNQTNFILYSILLACWLVGCIPQNQIPGSDFEKGMQTEPSSSINEKNEPCHLTENKNQMVEWFV